MERVSVVLEATRAPMSFRSIISAVGGAVFSAASGTLGIFFHEALAATFWLLRDGAFGEVRAGFLE